MAVCRCAAYPSCSEDMMHPWVADLQRKSLKPKLSAPGPQQRETCAQVTLNPYDLVPHRGHRGGNSQEGGGMLLSPGGDMKHRPPVRNCSDNVSRLRSLRRRQDKTAARVREPNRSSNFGKFAQHLVSLLFLKFLEII